MVPSRRALELGIVAVLLALAWGAGSARAHWEDPAAIVADLNAPAARAATGVESATRDPAAPRLLVIRVGERWYQISVAIRVALVRDWFERWRRNVNQGIVSVIDARTEKPVARIAREGSIVEVTKTRPPG